MSSGFGLGTSQGPREIFWLSGMYIPTWGSVRPFITNPSLGMSQEIHPGVFGPLPNKSGILAGTVGVKLGIVCWLGYTVGVLWYCGGIVGERMS